MIDKTITLPNIVRNVGFGVIMYIEPLSFAIFAIMLQERLQVVIAARKEYAEIHENKA